VADAFPPGCCHYPLIEPKLLYREVLMISSLQLSARRQEKDKATCEHYGYPVWVEWNSGRSTGPGAWGAGPWGRW
jgi:hypothetical protein